MRPIIFLPLALLASASAAWGFTFQSIDGGEIDLTEWRGSPVLVVNTASRCAFTHQYDMLQGLYDAYRTEGLVVLAVPSNEFRQELASAEAVAEFCEINYDLDLPMTDITALRGAEAHPFYAWLKQETGFEPRWNFNKVLLDPEGAVAGMWGSGTRPTDQEIVSHIERMLPD